MGGVYFLGTSNRFPYTLYWMYRPPWVGTPLLWSKELDSIDAPEAPRKRRNQNWGKPQIENWKRKITQLRLRLKLSWEFKRGPNLKRGVLKLAGKASWRFIQGLLRVIREMLKQRKMGRSWKEYAFWFGRLRGDWAGLRVYLLSHSLFHGRLRSTFSFLFLFRFFFSNFKFEQTWFFFFSLFWLMNQKVTFYIYI